ncbi:MAG TPA: multiple monosaccharide ABC transporter permease [Paracoccus sp. (in: a-proteobacteria)]|uniref:multiple monosaccharide ABC transporter permease n=1 Tax=Paracoccus sp. TaxID=267 RepID=UPI002BAAACA5|nr:multiple monosaccharide ABC transporter permease [Paracoccus sp. (in: a-proteobacteria)]HWL55284.1 multiple monosaccharide ABC transporter permease [Paracoccus sp. (in: a-proteobacteria)]
MSDTTETRAGGDTFGFIRRNIREYGILFALIIIMAFFQVVTGGILFRPVNLTNLFLQNSHIVIMAVGMLLIIVAGHIDLSVGSVAAFVGALAALMIVKLGLPIPVVVVLSLMAGALIGAAQGYWVAYWKIPSFIVTLAGMLIFRGLTMWILQGQSIGPFPREFQMIASGFIPDFFGPDKPNTLSLILGWGAALIILWLQVRNRRREETLGIADEPFAFFVAKNALIFVALAWMTWALANFRGLPNVFIVMAVLVALYAFLSERTTIGRRIFAIGGNAKAAKLSGINSERVVFLTFMNMGMLAALAGLVVSARLNSATPKAGVGFELDVIAAVFIGGASMSGGVGTVIGAVVGAFIMGVMNNGMSILGIGIDYQQVIKGLVLMAAVIFDVSNKSKS